MINTYPFSFIWKVVIIVSDIDQTRTGAEHGVIMSDKEKTYLILINDGPYGNEKPYNALRLAMHLANRDLAKVRVFLIGDGVQCAIQSQETPQGYYNIEKMVSFITRKGKVAT